MKRFLCLAMSLAVCGVFTTYTHAAEGITADEQEILDALSDGVVVDGTTMHVPAQYVREAEIFLQENDLSIKQVQAVLKEIEAVKAIVRKHNIKNMVMMNESAATDIFSHTQKAADVVNVTLKMNADHSVGVYDEDGELIFTADKTVVKETGSDYTLMYITTICIATVLAGIGAIAGKKGYFKK